MVKQPNGTYESVQIPGKMVTRYAIGGAFPLDMGDALIANIEQYHRAAFVTRNTENCWNPV